MQLFNLAFLVLVLVLVLLMLSLLLLLLKDPIDVNLFAFDSTHPCE